MATKSETLGNIGRLAILPLCCIVAGLLGYATRESETKDNLFICRIEKDVTVAAKISQVRTSDNTHFYIKDLKGQEHEYWRGFAESCFTTDEDKKPMTP